MKPILWLSCTIALMSSPVATPADQAIIAVASNFTAPMKQIIAAFEQQTNHRVKASFGSTGKFYAQIKNGAPFQALLAADQQRPQLLEEEGTAVAGSRFTYAVGTLVLWSAKRGMIEDGPALLRNGVFNKLALANPRLAPYGHASIETLEALNLKDRLEPKLVMGENIAQTYQFVDTGNADIGFVALSQVMAGGDNTKGSGWIVSADMHEPIHQDAVLLLRGDGKPAVSALLEFLQSEKAKVIVRDYGYATE
ncbi:MAG: molybdate ABC transporter substrate-binding protein [Thiohalocapsa sp.]